MGTILDKMAVEGERTVEQNQIVPMPLLKPPEISPPPAGSRHRSNKCLLLCATEVLWLPVTQQKHADTFYLLTPACLSRQKPPIPAETLCSSPIDQSECQRKNDQKSLLDTSRTG